jgi:D-alanyl-D-alanine carboxypeptidase (penicillin-binding protein 5/6)
VQGVGLIAVHGSARPTSIASVAKVMTAYVLLQDHPLRGGASGPQIEVSPAAVAAYRADLAGGQSVVPVRVGERLSERQALEGLLLPSGNNIATLLAAWDAGSQPVFVARMNADARALGLAHTHYTGASGLQASTVSTAGDQVRLAMRAMQIPVFAHIVGMAQATLPVAGRQFNRDAMLGQDGIVGIKTGRTSAAGGCFLFAARRRVGGHQIVVIGAVLHQLSTPGQPTLADSAFAPARTLLASTGRVVVARRVVARGQTVAWAKASWTDRTALRATRSVSLVGWPGLPIHTTIAPGPPLNAPLASGQRVGTAVLTAGGKHATAALVAAAAAPGASVTWRLSHP